MDLIEATMKIVENRNIVQTSLKYYKEDLKQYEKYINELKEKLQETQLTNSHNKEILEINNFTKNSFNENCRIIKELFGILYNYIQQVQEKLSTILDQEGSLEELYKENEERYKALDTKFNNNLKLLEIMGNDSREKLLKENSDMQTKLNEINSALKKLDELLKNTTDEHEEKYRSLEAMKLEVEILHDHLEKEQQEEDLRLKLIQENEEINKKALDNAVSELEIVENNLAAAEEEVCKIKEDVTEKLKVRDEKLSTYNTLKGHLEKLNKDCEDIERLINETREISSRTEDDITEEIELKKIAIQKREQELFAFQNKRKEIDNELDKIHSKIEAVNEELQTMTSDCEEREKAKKEIVKNIEKMTEENESLTNESEKLQNYIDKCKKDLEQTESELQQLRSSLNLEISQIREKTEILDLQYAAEKAEVQNELQEMESEDNQLRKVVEDLETKIKDLKTKQSEGENERDENRNKVKNLTMQCETLSKEINVLETAKQETFRLIPIPPLKRSTTPKHMPPPRTLSKRSFSHFDSDSSIEGERLTYAEFMARKKIMKETKKQKRITQ